ncbi:MAG: hypothetical protein WCP14_00400 [bacterium]
MEGSKNDVEWNANCDKVKAANNGDYPDFWFKEIIINKVYDRAAEGWNK